MGDKGSSVLTGVILEATFPLITLVFLLDEQSLNQATLCQLCMTAGKWVFMLAGRHRLFFSSERGHFRGSYNT